MSRLLELFLCNKKGLSVLEALVQGGYAAVVRRVVLAADKNVAKDYYEELTACCHLAGIEAVNRKDNPQPLEGTVKIAIGWRWLIAADDLIVLHDSLLPRYRGFAPLVSMLVNGEPQLGVTALYASEGYDEGDIIGQRATDVRYPIKIGTAIDQVAELYASLVLDIASQVAAGKMPVATPQDHRAATYSLWRDESDYLINWQWPAEQIRRFVDAVGFPYLGAATFAEGNKYIITDAEALPDVTVENRTPGKVIFLREGLYPVVVCGKGLLQLNAVQHPDGTNALPLKKFRTKFNGL